MKSHKHNKAFIAPIGMVGITILSGAFLISNTVNADDVIDKVLIKVPVSCTLSGIGQNSHNAEIANNNVNSAIGETTVNAFCNDQNGFAIYAIGYTNEEDGNNVLTNATLGSTHDIVTGTATSGPTSNWAMKLAANSSDTYPVTIQNGFNNFHAVPSEYTLVAKRTTGTDIGIAATGSTFTTTYQAFISQTQAAGTYSGKVKYILVHPNDIPTPKSTMLDTGQVVSAKMKTLAAGTSTAYNTKTSDIKAIRMADELPAGFTPSDANTVSTSTSKHPIYIFFDNTNDAGIMYFYTGGYQVVMNPDSSHMFRSNLALSDISGLADWDSSNVTSMFALFVDSVASLTNVDVLANWDTSKVENMSALLALNAATATAGYTSQLSDISGLMNWDVSSVTNMYLMFQNASHLISLHGVELWDVSNVENMELMFAMGVSRTKVDDAVIDYGPLSNWDVSNVINMTSMFQNTNIASFLPFSNWDVSKVQNFHATFNQTNKSTTTSLAGLENWNVSSATNMCSMFSDSVSLIDSSAINGWDVRNVIVGSDGQSADGAGFKDMFSNAPVHPAFTLRAGTWDSSGTFIPSV